MKARLAGSAVLAVGLVLGATGCSLVAPQATTLHYDPSDGVSGTVGQIQIDNAFLVTDNGTDANLIAVLTNNGTKSQDVEIQYSDDGTKTDKTVTVPAGQQAKVGFDGDNAVELAGVDTPAGSLAQVFFQYGDETGALLDLPVLNTQMTEYQGLAPTPSATAGGQG